MATLEYYGLIQQNPPGVQSRNRYDEIVELLQKQPNVWYLAATGNSYDIVGYEPFYKRGCKVRRAKIAPNTYGLYVKWENKR